ncbi:MAG: SurA N-terminal domain-containing protein [Candidatus Hydrogenedentes bacterium]|nr:SurA N-terminal domain-containing protein [Candidatus Hydrogenedentota bacterium]
MMHWMRKHSKIIMWGIVIIIVPSFIAWGGYRRGRGRGRGDEQVNRSVVATVGGVPITREQYVNRLGDEVRRRTQYNQKAALEDLVADGTAEKILDGMIDAALINIEVNKMRPPLSRQYLVDRLKDDPSFKDESGKFSATLWNDWVTADRRQDWNAIYASVADQVSREILIKEVTAPARVLDQEVKDAFETSRTTYKVKFITVDPKITPTDEQIKAQYDEDPTKYQTPEKRYVEYVGFSLVPPRPAVLDEIVSKARGGGDFAALAGQYSDMPKAKENGGEVGWFTAEKTKAEFMKVTLDMKPGDVSDPVENNGAYYIFKVDQEKPDEKTGEPSKLIRTIMIRPQLSEEERKAVDDKANEFAAKAKESGDFTGTASQLGLTVQTAKELSTETTEIEGIPKEDAMTFISGIGTVPAGEMSEPIESVRHLYVAHRAPGEMAGPVEGYRSDAYFFDLVSKTPPTEETWTKDFPKEEEKLRKQMLAQRQSELLMEYVASLRERATTDGAITRDAVAISDALGLNKAAKGEGEGEGEGEPVAAEAAPGGTVSVQTAPAEGAPAGAAPAGTVSVEPAPAQTPPAEAAAPAEKPAAPPASQ